MKILLLIVLLFFTVGLAMALLARLTRTQQKIADLHQDLRRNNEEMARQRRELERLAAQHDAQNEERKI